MSLQDLTPADQQLWVQMCEAEGLDPELRLQARQRILQASATQDCTVYRPDDQDPEAEEEDLGDARILFTGVFEAPEHWSEEERLDYLDGTEPQLMVTALIECEESPSSKAFFIPDAGDYVACIDDGQVVMYYLYDYNETNAGRSCVLIRDEEVLG